LLYGRYTFLEQHPPRLCRLRSEKRTPAGYLFGGLAVKYTKPPLSIQDQIELLRSRGMEIADPSRTARYLSHINYYRLRGYWLPFEVPCGGSNHRFRNGTSFDNVLNLYVFDRKFRILILEAIERIEVSCRTQFAYVLALRHGSHAHMEAAIFQDKRWHKQLLEILSEEIKRSQETFIEHYRTKYSDPLLPPIWSACEVMSFGHLSQWIKKILN
jgi:abortive infection bacteriophage resistance protein